MKPILFFKVIATAARPLGLALAGAALSAFHADPVSAQESGATRIMDTKEIRIGYRTDEAPFSWEADGKPMGYAVELCQHIVTTVEQETGPLNVVYVPLSAAERIQSFDSQNIDMLCAGTSITLTRRQAVDFSIPIYFDGVTALISNDASERAKAIFAGELPRFRPGWRASLAEIFGESNVVVVQGTETETWLREGIHRFQLATNLTPVANNSDAVEAVQNGQAMAYFGKSSTLTVDMREKGLEDSAYISPITYTRQPIGIVVPRGNDNLLLAADTTLSALYRSGDILPIFEKYFGAASDDAKSLFELAAIPN